MSNPRPPTLTADNSFQNSDGLWLYTTNWMPSGKPTGVVFIIHGLGEYCERYVKVAETLNKQGLAVFSMDHQGHGKSEGLRVHVEQFGHFSRDVMQYVRAVLEKNPSLQGLPRFLFGCSMGGLITIQTAMLCQSENFEWSGALIHCPALFVDPAAVNPVMVCLLGLLNALIPKVPIPGQKGPVAIFPLSHDTASDKAYHADPLVYHGALRPRFSVEILKAMQLELKRAPEFVTPYLILHGTDDRICPMKGSEDFHAATGSKDKTFTKIDGAYHEMYNEVEPYKSQAYKHSTEWIKAHMVPPKR